MYFTPFFRCYVLQKYVVVFLNKKKINKKQNNEKEEKNPQTNRKQEVHGPRRSHEEQ